MSKKLIYFRANISYSDGQLTMNGSGIGETATFTCQPGFEFTGIIKIMLNLGNLIMLVFITKQKNIFMVITDKLVPANNTLPILKFTGELNYCSQLFYHFPLQGGQNFQKIKIFLFYKFKILVGEALK